MVPDEEIFFGTLKKPCKVPVIFMDKMIQAVSGAYLFPDLLFLQEMPCSWSQNKMEKSLDIAEAMLP